jgi:hypothetical protein
LYHLNRTGQMRVGTSRGGTITMNFARTRFLQFAAAALTLATWCLGPSSGHAQTPSELDRRQLERRDVERLLDQREDDRRALERRDVERDLERRRIERREIERQIERDRLDRQRN